MRDVEATPELRNRMFLSIIRAYLLAALLGTAVYASSSAAAQNDPVPLAGRPPIAASTSKIEVDSIPVVLSESQEAGDFTSGLLQGLLADGRAQGVAAIVVKGDHVMLLRNFGTLGPEAPFAAPALSDVFYAVAVMQLVEHGRVSPDEDIGKALGEERARGITIAQVMTRRAGNPQLLARMIEKVTRISFADYLEKEIIRPLGLTATGFRSGRIQTTVNDAGRLAMALVNGGTLQNGRILAPASVETMESTHFAVHPALPGWAYGFAEMRRNGWRALQQDGAIRGSAIRLVIIPDAKLAYFLAVRGRTDAPFWRTLDNGLFDKLLMPSKAGSTSSAAGIPAPGPEQARAVRGIYEAARDPALTLSFLKTGDRRLEVRAGSDGSLILSGAENATLAPRPGLYWGTADGNLNAIAHDGELMLSTGTYRPLAFYERPAVSVSLALLAALGMLGVALLRQTKHAVRFWDRIASTSHQDNSK